MQFAIGQRMVVIEVAARGSSATTGRRGSSVERSWESARLARQLEAERLERERRAASALGWWFGLYGSGR